LIRLAIRVATGCAAIAALGAVGLAIGYFATQRPASVPSFVRGRLSVVTTVEQPTIEFATAEKDLPKLIHPPRPTPRPQPPVVVQTPPAVSVQPPPQPPAPPVIPVEGGG
jgi:hypothetical protein